MDKVYETDKDYGATDHLSEAQILEDILERSHKKKKPNNSHNKSNDNDTNVSLYLMMNSVM